MQDTKSLVQSRAFWSAALALVASAASAFHFGQIAAWAGNPSAIDQVMNAVAGLGALGAIVFRYQATARTTTVLPPGSGPGAGKAMALVCALPLAGAVAGCSQAQLSIYAGAAGSAAGALRQIGADVVRLDCRYGGLAQVIARDVGAAARVQAALDKNASLLRDACPGLASAPSVSVAAGG